VWFYGEPSLTIGRACLLYMLLFLASVVFLGSESLRTRDHTLLSQIGDIPFRRLLRLGRSRWRYSNPPSRGCDSCKVGVKIVLRPTVSRQFCLEPESESYVTTDSQSASLSWNKAPIWGLRPDINYCLTITVLFCGALSLTRGRVCLLYMLLALASAVLLRSESLCSRDHILLSQI
jgi:hypothetical protein